MSVRAEWMVVVALIACGGEPITTVAPKPPSPDAASPNATTSAADAAVAAPIGNPRLLALRDALLAVKMLKEYRARIEACDVSASSSSSSEAMTWFIVDRYVRELLPRRVWGSHRTIRVPLDELVDLEPIVDPTSARAAIDKLEAFAVQLERDAAEAKEKELATPHPSMAISLRAERTRALARFAWSLREATAAIRDALTGGAKLGPSIAELASSGSSAGYGLDVQLAAVQLFEEAALLGKPSIAAPIIAPSTGPIRQIAAGSEFSCALTSGGDVFCWGRNTSGQIGDGTTAEERRTPRAVVDLHDAVEITAAGYGACARLRDGTVRCWGRGTSADDRANSPILTRPVSIAGVAHARQLAATMDLACALGDDARVMCWGRFDQWGADWKWPAPGGTGELYGNRYWRSVSGREIPELRGASRVIAGGDAVCGLFPDRTLRCVGTPILSRSRDVIDVAAGTGGPEPGAEMCILSARGYVRCGYGDAIGNAGAPVTLALLDYVHGAAISDAGTLRWWGDRHAAECKTDCAASLPPLAQVVFGDHHGLALTRDGRVFCWGNGMYGECGRGDARDFVTPVVVPLGTTP